MPGFDYRRAGAYYITVVTQHRLCLFGEIENGTMRTNDAGQMIQRVWDEMPHHYNGVGIDAFVLMPNHAHGIIFLAGAAPCGRPDPNDPPGPVGAAPRGRPSPLDGDRPDPADRGDFDDRGGTGQARGPAPTLPEQSVGVLSVADVLHRFKTMTTKRFADGVGQHGWPPFPSRLWHRNYYEHVIRNEVALRRIRGYIAGNPARWAEDPDNPQFDPRGPLRRPAR